MTRKLLAAALAVVALTAVGPGEARGYRRTDTQIAPGVVHSAIRDPRGPWRIHVVSIDLAQESTIDVALAQDQLPGFERTSAMGSRHGALVAMNGDYARESGRPVMTFAKDGDLIQTALTWGVNFSVDRFESNAFVAHVDPSMWATEADTGITHPITRINSGPPGYEEVGAFTYAGRWEEQPPRDACSTRLRRNEGTTFTPGPNGVVTSNYVETNRCSSRRLFTKGGTVLSTPRVGTYAPAISALVPGEQVSVGWSMGWPEVLDTIGGNPMIVKHGRNSVIYEPTPFFHRHPRTGVGFTRNGRVLFVTVDGRQPGYSVGMTPSEFADLFVSLRARRAVNLDGGGSTTMWIDGRIVNRPSDGSERPVSSALLLLPGLDVGELQPTPQPTPIATLSPTTAPASPTPTVSAPPPLTLASPWRAIVRDPASTGGLAWTLLTRGVPLTGSLLDAARAFAFALAER